MLSGLARGLEESYTQIADAVVPDSSPLKLFADWSVAAVAQKSVSKNFTPQQTVPEEKYVESTFTKQSDVRVIQFSDEVDILFEKDGVGVVRPVFKNASSGQEYRVLLAPTSDDG